MANHTKIMDDSMKYETQYVPYDIERRGRENTHSYAQSSRIQRQRLYKTTVAKGWARIESNSRLCVFAAGRKTLCIFSVGD